MKKVTLVALLVACFFSGCGGSQVDDEVTSPEKDAAGAAVAQSPTTVETADIDGPFSQSPATTINDNQFAVPDRLIDSTTPPKNPFDAQAITRPPPVKAAPSFVPDLIEDPSTATPQPTFSRPTTSQPKTNRPNSFAPADADSIFSGFSPSDSLRSSFSPERRAETERPRASMVPRKTTALRAEPKSISPSVNNATSTPRINNTVPPRKDEFVTPKAVTSFPPRAEFEPAASMAMDEPSVESGPAAIGQPDRATALTEEPRDNHSVVKVFYGTDREPIIAADDTANSLGGYQNALVAFGATLALGGLAFFSSRRKLAFGIGAVGLIVSLFLFGQSVLTTIKSTGDGQVALKFGGKRGDLQLGVCEVSIPKDHRLGEVEAPSILKLEVREDKEKHVVLLNLEPKVEDQFYGELRELVDESERHEAFVFIHGYNVSFENAARRTAQIAHDLKFDGAPILYSWPSQASVFGYTVDENNVTWTVPHLKKFLIDVSDRSGATSLHLVAHSMGNRALTSALRELTYELQDDARRFNQVILAAPDVDADVFKRDIAPAITRTANRVTLYASSNDHALIASKKVHGYPRAGDSGDGLVIIPGIETIDVSSIDTSLLGHSYYGDNDSIIADLHHLLKDQVSAQSRRWLRPVVADGLTYWVFHALDVEVATPATGPQIR